MTLKGTWIVTKHTAYFLARSRAYATMSVSICLWRKWIVVMVHAGKREGVISRYASHS